MKSSKLAGVWAVLVAFVLGGAAFAQKNQQVTVDSVVINTTKSKIDVSSVGDYYFVIVKVDYSAAGPRTITCAVRNENTDAWEWATTDTAGAAYQVAQGTGTVGFGYLIKKDSTWGELITNGQWPYAYCKANLASIGGGPGGVNLFDDNFVTAK